MSIEYFQIIEEIGFQQKIDSYRKKYDRIDNVHEGITWVLSKNPSYGTLVKNPIRINENRIFHTTAIGKTPSFWVLYEIDLEKKHVMLLSIHPIKETLE